MHIKNKQKLGSNPPNNQSKSIRKSRKEHPVGKRELMQDKPPTQRK